MIDFGDMLYVSDKPITGNRSDVCEGNDIQVMEIPASESAALKISASVQGIWVWPRIRVT